MQALKQKADICLILEGTYPYVTGGVSGWAHGLITEAGGKISDYSGGPLTVTGKQNLTSNGLIHAALLKELEPHRHVGLTPVK